MHIKEPCLRNRFDPARAAANKWADKRLGFELNAHLKNT